MPVIPVTWEAEASGSLCNGGQPGLHVKFQASWETRISKTKQNKKLFHNLKNCTFKIKITNLKSPRSLLIDVGKVVALKAGWKTMYTI